MTARIQLDGVAKRYGIQAVEALHGVSLTVQPGEFVALMGPSGCGKSTLLNLIGAMDQPTSGRILLNDTDIAGLSDPERTRLRGAQIGFVFQFFNLLNTLTVFENVALPLELQSAAPEVIRTRVAGLLDSVGMSHRRDFYPSQLSGGEMQRVAIARALVHQPALILADEPTGNLDTENGRNILALLRALGAESGPTIVMATHSEEAASVADRVIRMRDGRFVEPVA